jgi:exoribonuclease R
MEINGIYRTIKSEFVVGNDVYPKNVQKFLKGFKSLNGGTYSKTPDSHDILGFNVYAHTTSPIRRLPDLLNLYILQKSLKIHEFGDEAEKCFKYWITHLDLVNNQMKAIRKTQNQCKLLDLCANDNSLFTKTFTSYLCEKLDINKYIIYIPELNLVYTMKTDRKVETKHYTKLYYFKNKNNFAQKIVVGLLQSKGS